MGVLDHGKRRVRAVAFSPDGAVLATGCDDQLLRFWRADTGTPERAPLSFDAELAAVAFSPSAPHVAVADANGRVRIQDIQTRALIHDIQAHPTWIEGIEYSADGQSLVTAGRQDHTAKVWDAQTGKLRATLSGHANNLIRASFNPDATLVGTVSVDDTARIWDARSGEALRVIRGPAYTARFSPDGRELLTTGLRDYIVIWDATLLEQSPQAIAQLVRARSPWELRDGYLSLRAGPIGSAPGH